MFLILCQFSSSYEQEEKTIAAVKCHDNLNIIICINQYLLQFYGFEIFCQTILINFKCILSCLVCFLQARAYKNSSVLPPGAFVKSRDNLSSYSLLSD